MDSNNKQGGKPAKGKHHEADLPPSSVPGAAPGAAAAGPGPSNEADQHLRCLYAGGRKQKPEHKSSPETTADPLTARTKGAPPPAKHHDKHVSPERGGEHQHQRNNPLPQHRKPKADHHHHHPNKHAATADHGLTASSETTTAGSSTTTTTGTSPHPGGGPANVHKPASNHHHHNNNKIPGKAVAQQHDADGHHQRTPAAGHHKAKVGKHHAAGHATTTTTTSGATEPSVKAQRLPGAGHRPKHDKTHHKNTPAEAGATATAASEDDSCDGKTQQLQARPGNAIGGPTRPKQTEGVQQLLMAEQRAAQRISEARKRKIRRVREAREEAHNEAEKYRAERTKLFKAIEAAQASWRANMQKRIEVDTQRTRIELDALVKRNRAKVVKGLISIIWTVKPELHRNYFFAAARLGMLHSHLPR